jgi:hypothetical protein
VSTIPVFTVDLTGEVLGRGVHGLVEHDWSRDGWEPLTPVVMSADGAQVFEASVVDGRGVVTGTQAGNGGLRVAYLRSGTDWRDGEVRSLVYGPTADWDGSNAQQGHLHRVRQVSSGLWEGIAVWTTVVGGFRYDFLHCNAVRFDGTTLSQGTGAPGFGATDASSFERRVVVNRANRVDAFDVVQFRHCLPTHLYGLADGDLVSVTGMVEASLNLSNVAVSGVNRSTGFFQAASATAGDLTDEAAGGTVLHAGVDVNRRYCPFWLATRAVGGTGSSVTVEAKRWRPEDPEPDWGDARVLRGTITPSVGVPALPNGAGLHGLWNAHYHDGSGGAWGDLRFRRLT